MLPRCTGPRGSGQDEATHPQAKGPSRKRKDTSKMDGLTATENPAFSYGISVTRLTSSSTSSVLDLLLVPPRQRLGSSLRKLGFYGVS